MHKTDDRRQTTELEHNHIANRMHVNDKLFGQSLRGGAAVCGVCSGSSSLKREIVDIFINESNWVA